MQIIKNIISTFHKEFAKLTKTKKVLLVILMVLLITGVLYLISLKPLHDLSVNSQIVEPNAPLATNLNILNFSTSNKNNRNDITALGNINTIVSSPNKQNNLVLTSKNNTSTYSLSLTDNSGSILNTIALSSVINATFQTDNTLTYQTINTSSDGVYVYSLKDNKSNLVVNSSDPQTFNNIVMIDDLNYFFIQPKTGTIGFGKIGSSNQTIIDQKVLKTQSAYVQVGAYTLARLSPDKKFISFIDQSPILTSSQNTLGQIATVNIIPIYATSIKDIYYKTTISINPGSLNNNSQELNWSRDSKYLVASDNATIIDVSYKKVFFSLSDKIGNAYISPNQDKFIVNNQSDNLVSIRNFTNNNQLNIGKDISDAQWLNNDSVILIIGQRLYTFDLNTQKLEAVTLDKANFNILNINTIKGIALVKKNDQIIQVTKK